MSLLGSLDAEARVSSLCVFPVMDHNHTLALTSTVGPAAKCSAEHGLWVAPEISRLY